MRVLWGVTAMSRDSGGVRWFKIFVEEGVDLTKMFLKDKLCPD